MEWRQISRSIQCKKIYIGKTLCRHGNKSVDELKSLSAFVHVARTGSFTAAAAGLGITTPTVSKLVSELEHRVDARLFHRSTRRLSLTSEGRDFFEHAAAALDEIDRGIDRLREARREPAGTIRLWSTAVIGKDHLLPLLRGFLDANPKVDVELRFDDHVPDLVAGGYDLSVQHTPTADRTQVMRRLCELPLALVVSPACLERYGVPGSPAELASRPCITTRNSAGLPGQWSFRRAGPGGREESVVLAPQGRLRLVEQYEGVLQAAVAGLGFTSVFAYSALPYLRAGDLRVVLPDWTVHGSGVEGNEVFLRYPQRRHQPLQVRALIDYIVTHFSDPAVLQFDAAHWAA